MVNFYSCSSVNSTEFQTTVLKFKLFFQTLVLKFKLFVHSKTKYFLLCFFLSANGIALFSNFGQKKRFDWLDCSMVASLRALGAFRNYEHDQQLRYQKIVF